MIKKCRSNDVVEMKKKKRRNEAIRRIKDKEMTKKWCSRNEKEKKEEMKQ